ncbi:MAG: hypothetical protein ACYC5M_05955 [Anaerolineae bacterium]
MGESCTPRHVHAVVSALGALLAGLGTRVDPEKARRAVEDHLGSGS